MLAVGAPSDFAVRSIRWSDGVVVLAAEGAAASVNCPDCGARSDQVHDRYTRHPLDLPRRGCTVRLALTVRRFACPNLACGRATFAEDFGPGLPRHAQRTAGASETLLAFGLAVGGEAGARLAGAIGLPASADTLLRLVGQHADGRAEAPRVLGVDDLALRRGVSYATLLVDIEAHRPVDLLEGRDAEVLAAWLRAHPGAQIIVRDRSEAYARGAKDGAPEAQQVADRFHLTQNASAALEELLRGRKRVVEGPEEPAPAAKAAAKPLSPTRQQEEARRAARAARWEAVRALQAAGESRRGIARELGISRATVRRVVAAPAPPRRQVSHPRPGGLKSPTLQPFVGYLQDRWQAGCHNVSQLFREIKARGYPGSRTLLDQATRPWRPPRPPPGERRKRRRLSLRWLCLRPPDRLQEDERAILARTLAEDAGLAAGYDLLQRFRSLVAGRDVAALATWLADARNSGLPPFVSLANGIAGDRAAVEAALTTPWSNGMVEGFVHKVKLIKRQGYGRAGLDLLRARVLAA